MANAKPVSQEAPASPHSLHVSGVVNTVETIVSLIGRMDPVVAALPEVLGLVEAAISTFSNEGKATVVAAYKAKMAKTDADHEATQEALAKVDATSDISGTDGSPKGGAQ